ncbi:cytosine permease [Streptomyces sp. NBC_01669]|uniref:purine-cytosine permease family protein n=1 Tax=Streptomyces sp. NBC_01669 TaxID=2975909 RepID=UPI002253FC01|nr:cytosine permease [Streptomyces sp. NBC_01669]MCX4537668.1 cytosine permease [Streptomyces sp. NBC_01669]
MTTAEPARTATELAPPPTSGDAVHIETRGIDYIPDDERHGRPRDLFFVWAASNVNYLSIVLGGTLVLLGLNTWQALLVVVLGNLFWAFNGILAISGPVSGTPCSVLTRATYGIRGNRVSTVITNWSVCVAYEAINLAMGALAGFALLDQLGVAVGTATRWAVVLVLAAVTIVVSVYGHALIVRLSPAFTWMLTITLTVLAGFVVAHAEPGRQPEGAPHGGDLLAMALLGFAIIASGPLSWGTGADYARYLPADSSPRAVAGWTTLGGFIPSVILGAVGVLAGTAVDMEDPQVSLEEIVPGWFYPLFLLAIVIGSVASNILTMYSSGLALQAVGLPIRQWAAVLLDGVAGVAITAYALFVTDFIDALSHILELTVAILGPGLAISVADLILRRNHYRGPGLHDETPTSAYWYHAGVNWAGITAQVLGTTAALLCINSTKYQGPLTDALGGADLSALVGPIIGAGLYAVLFKRLYPAHLAQARADA